MISQSLSTAAFSIIKLRQKMEPATLLAESLSQPGGDDRGGLGVKLADLVATVIVLGVGQIGIAPLGLAPGGVRRTGIGRPGPSVEPVHELILSRREIRTASQIEPDSGSEIHWPRHFLTLRNHEVPASVPAASGDGIEGEQLVGGLVG